MAMCHPPDEETQKRIDALLSKNNILKSKLYPNSHCLIAEIERRASWLNLSDIKPKSWDNHKCKQWIEENKLSSHELELTKSKLETYLKEKESSQAEKIQQAATNEILNKHNRKKNPTLSCHLP